jgi:DNA-binding MarR family transcriptional regulator
MAGSVSDVQRARLLEALHDHGLAYGELGRRFGSAIGLHVTDATALVEILGAQDRGAPLTQTQLGQRVGLTPGATSTLLNRLETAGHIRRVRDTRDRRVITLIAADSVETLLHRFFDPLADRMAIVMSRYPPEVLAQFEALLTAVSAAMNDYADEATRRGTAQT